MFLFAGLRNFLYFCKLFYANNVIRHDKSHKNKEKYGRNTIKCGVIV